MKKINYILMFLTLGVLCLTNCSYVSDSIEAAITKRSSFSIKALYDYSTDSVIISWDETDSSDIAGIEIYITEEPGDEYAGYILAASKWRDNSGTSYTYGDHGNLNLGTTNTFTLDASSYSKGRYFFRIAFIAWSNSKCDRSTSKGYNPGYDYDQLISDYLFSYCAGIGDDEDDQEKRNELQKKCICNELIKNDYSGNTQNGLGLPYDVENNYNSKTSIQKPSGSVYVDIDR